METLLTDVLRLISEYITDADMAKLAENSKQLQEVVGKVQSSNEYWRSRISLVTSFPLPLVDLQWKDFYKALKRLDESYAVGMYFSLDLIMTWISFFEESPSCLEVVDDFYKNSLI